MLAVLTKIWNALSMERWNLSYGPLEAALSKYFRFIQKSTKTTDAVMVVQCVEDPFYFGLFGQIASSLREHQPVRVDQFVLRSLNVGEFDSVWKFIKLRLISNHLTNCKWVGLYKSFCNRVAYRNSSIHLFADLSDLYDAWNFWRRMNTKEDLINLTIKGVSVGDLINDSYLRFKPAPTVDLQDAYLLILIWQSLCDLRQANQYFKRVKPSLYLTSNSTYTQHGVPVRVALQCGIKVFSFGNYQEFTKKLSLTDWVHTKKADNYAYDFFEFDKQTEKIALADAALSSRINGVVDSATLYMKKSAYAVSEQASPDVKGAIVIFLHDFYDSPHVYYDMVFPDFWEWLCFTIDTLRIVKVRFFIKPHPNQISLSEDVLPKIKSRYPSVPFISSEITNKQLAEAGMACGITVYGTVAHEMAYLGIPTIGCARHPHISFEFCKTAKSRDEYGEMLLHYGESSIDRSEMRKQSLIFYYMHNLNVSEDEKLLVNACVNLRRYCAERDEKSQDLISLLKQISILPAYQQHIAAWWKLLQRL